MNPDAVLGVQAAGQSAREVWSHQIMREPELAHLAAWCPSGQFCPAHLVTAASSAAIELAIVVALWSERPSWE
jgi:hypothetical protein